MKLVILCEGITEEKILKDFLTIYCPNFDKVSVFSGNGKDKLKADFKRKAELFLQEDASNIVFCLIDLYEAPFVYPKKITEAENPTIAQFAYIKKWMEDAIELKYSGRFFAFPVVMEIETWLLADTEGLNAYFKPPKSQEIKAFTAPENIVTPATELSKIWKRFKPSAYEKVLHGERLFRHASAKRVYEDTCYHFELIINKLLELQGIEAPKPSIAYIEPNAALFAELARLAQEYDIIYEQVINKADATDNDYQQLYELESQIEALNKKIQEQHPSNN